MATSPNSNPDGTPGHNGANGTHAEGHVVTISGMYENYFLDYASYVILERAVPAIEDGLKPVQRRILHAMYEKDDGRYHKVANIIGNTMQYHPHGDAAIGDALVNIGQKELLIDTQGNWGDYRTGDSAAASRYIEARLTKFALEVAFNPQTTEWSLSYDGRKREPVNLPMKFPLILAQGTDGIAVGLSTKILPHNFIELIKASIDILHGKSVKIYPDFMTGGSIDVTDYNGGQRGGKVKVRAKIEKADKNIILIKELPYGVTTVSLAESIGKAVEKGQIKIKKIDDNTAAEVEIAIELMPGTSPDVTIDALYAFTDCEVSISPNACIITDDKPIFTTVEEILRISTENTKDLLRQELEIKRKELEEKWLFASLEKIFIENRIYHQIEECESWEEVIAVIYRELRKYVSTPSDQNSPSGAGGDKRLKLFRELTDDDITRLTEIRIKRISKFNSFKADELIERLIEELEETEHHLAHLTEYAVAYFNNLLEKYGKGRERRTTISGGFETIQVSQVVANNAKLYVDLKEGFVGMGLKKDGEFVCDCSDIDDVIVFRKDGKMVVTRIADKTFVGKDIIHVDVWKKNDERTTYNMIYVDAKSGVSKAKRFNVTAITRDKEYDLTMGNPNSKCLYFSANPNGEAELVTITLSQGCTARIKVFDFGFSDLEIKGRASQGNIVTKYPIKKVVLKEAGQSTIGAIKVYVDEVSGRLTTDERAKYLGAFDTGDLIMVLWNDGTYELNDFDLTRRYDVNNLLHIGKFDPEQVVNAVYFDGNKEWTMVKRFKIETSKLGEKFSYLSDHKNSKLLFASVKENPRIEYSVKVKGKKLDGEVSLGDFMDVKGWKAMGNRLSDQKLLGVKELEEKSSPVGSQGAEVAKVTGSGADEKLHVGDTIDFDEGGQGKLF
ncbi:MAG: DNA gyrase/topoisomerase IV subunit A [Saprospiraceae bacterium]|nr:DNA gyrase/topoisomerase IV subunit A [Saprospiraceae bacterium]